MSETAAVLRAPNRQANANRRNATHSTPPVTPEGLAHRPFVPLCAPKKTRASLNALRHALTGQTVVLPADDLAAYQRSCAEFHAELKPNGLLETKLVQAIADPLAS